MKDSNGADLPAAAERSRAPGGLELRLGDTILEGLGAERRREKQVLRWSVAIALLFHGVMFSLTFSSHGTAPDEVRREQKVFVLQQPRFKPPAPPRGQPKPPERRTKKIPIPDPTPDEPEPIVDPEIVTPEVDLDLDDMVLGIPEAPPGVGESPAGSGEGPLAVGGEVQPPERLYDPKPAYTEEARMARIQGIVILQTIIDEEGNVTHLKVLKGLPQGLTESAVETVLRWKFKPATRNGEPVSVYFHLSVRFSLM